MMGDRNSLPLIIAVGLFSTVALAETAPQMPRLHAELAQADGFDDNALPPIPGHEPEKYTPPKAGATEAQPPAPKPLTRAESLDTLFARLSKAKDADEAAGIVAVIQRIWMESGSDTADLLMSRAMSATEQNQQDVALALLDRIVTICPDWAEGWNKRATLRFLGNDDVGSLEDIGHTLAIEPRHFGALSGLGFILKRNGLDKAALKALRRAEEIYPESPDIRKAVDSLAPDVDGRDL